MSPHLVTARKESKVLLESCSVYNIYSQTVNLQVEEFWTGASSSTVPVHSCKSRWWCTMLKFQDLLNTCCRSSSSTTGFWSFDVPWCINVYMYAHSHEIELAWSTIYCVPLIHLALTIPFIMEIILFIFDMQSRNRAFWSMLCNIPSTMKPIQWYLSWRLPMRLIIVYRETYVRLCYSL